MKAADVDRVLAINAAASVVDGVSALDEATMRALRDTPEQVTAVVEDDGFVVVLHGEMSFAVVPAARGGGLGDRLARLGVEAGAERMWLHGPSASGYALAGRNGLIPKRELWVMRRAAAPVPAWSVPDGLVLRAFEPGDEAELVRVNAAAFAWHPEQGRMDLADVASRMAEPWFSAEGLLMLWSGDEPGAELLGFHWTKRHPDLPDGRTLGEIYVIGIDPAAQGRGLGRLLTLAGLAHMAALDEVLLYVESDNKAAVRLYESLDFTHAPRDTHVQFARPYIDAQD